MSNLSKSFAATGAQADVPEDHEFVPLFDRLLVEEDAPTMTESGLVLPDMANRPRPGRGFVVACGPGRYDAAGNWITVPPGVSPGVTVLFNQHSGVEVTINDKVFLMLNSGDLLGYVATPEVIAAARKIVDEAQVVPEA